ncbi:DUF4157 domain-containing protein [Amycolatopsis magusensis]|uniref:DUF4157 domain-containing protein n=1 Tax=Amycolatopsis magusensis TaxID=882444 RepID=UPI0037AA0A81
MAVAAPLGRLLSADVSAVPVRRGRAVAQLARRFDARAFTHEGIVHLPDSLGALDGAAATPVLAHELTHAVQQRRYGAALPEPDSAEGQELEAEAVAIEQWFADDFPQTREPAPAETPIRHPAVQLAPRDAPTSTSTGNGKDEVPEGLLLLLQLAEQEREQEREQEQEPPEEKQPEETPALSLEDILKALAEKPPRRWVDLDDNKAYLELSNRLYADLVSRLRFDFLVERERSGSLSDFG